ncbi:MAG: Yip1 family protein [Sphingobium sp.]
MDSPNNPNIPNLMPERAALIERTKAILLQPKAEWERIDTEPMTVAGIYRAHVIPLAAIPAVCTAIGSLVLGHSMFGITYRPSVAGAVTGAAVSYALTLLGVYVLAVIIDALAPNFNATPNRIQAFKVAAYSWTASWVAGIFGLIPALAWLSLLGIYGLFLLYLGLRRLMKAPEEKALGYTALTVVAAIVLAIVASAITAPVVAMFARTAPAGQLEGKLAVPGVGSVDLGKLEAASKKMEAAANQLNQVGTPGNGAAIALPADQLQALLPAALPGYGRTEIASSSGSAAGVGGSHAEARYTAGEGNIRLELTDMAAVGALAALGSALNVQSSRQTETGYEKTQTIDGRMVSEEWDGQSKSGKFSVVVANRFLVEARGDNVDMNAIKGAVMAVGIDRLEGLAKQ